MSRKFTVPESANYLQVAAGWKQGQRELRPIIFFGKGQSRAALFLTPKELRGLIDAASSALAYLNDYNSKIVSHKDLALKVLGGS